MPASRPRGRCSPRTNAPRSGSPPSCAVRQREILAEEANLAGVLERAASRGGAAVDDELFVATALVLLREEQGSVGALLPLLESLAPASPAPGAATARSLRARASFDGALAALLERAGRLAESDRWHDAAVRGAREAGDTRLEGLVLLRRAQGGRMLGRAREAQEALAAALAIAARTNDPVVGSLAERLVSAACQQALDVEDCTDLDRFVLYFPYLNGGTEVLTFARVSP